MHALAFYMAVAHRQDLLAEAEADRLARLSQPGDPGVAAWRRTLGRGAQGISGAFAGVARSLDPCLDGTSRPMRAV